MDKDKVYFVIYCEQIENWPRHVETDICELNAFKWQFSAVATALLLFLIIYVLRKWKYRCHQTLLTFHNLRAACLLLLFAINTLELARACLPQSMPKSTTTSGLNGSASGYAVNAYGNYIVPSNNHNNNNNNNNNNNGNEPPEVEEPPLRVVPLLMIDAAACICNALSALALTLVLIWYHRVIELKKRVAYLYFSCALCCLLFLVRILNLSEVTYEHSMWELESCLEFGSALCLLAVGVMDGVTVYKERYRPDYLEDYGKIGYRHTLATFYSKASFWWLNPLLWFGYKEPLELEDLGQMRLEDSARAHYDHFLLIYKTAKVKTTEQEPRPRPPSLWLCYVKNSWRMFTLGGALKLCGDLFALIGPLAIQQIVQYIEAMYAQAATATTNDIVPAATTVGGVLVANEMATRLNLNRYGNNNSSIALGGFANDPYYNTNNNQPHYYNNQLSDSNKQLLANIKPISILLQRATGAAAGLPGHVLAANAMATENNSYDGRDVTAAAYQQLLDFGVTFGDLEIYYPSWLDLLSNGWVIAWIVLLAALAQAALSQASTHILNMTGIRMKTSLQGLIYRKTLLLHSSCIVGANDDERRKTSDSYHINGINRVDGGGTADKIVTGNLAVGIVSGAGVALKTGAVAGGAAAVAGVDAISHTAPGLAFSEIKAGDAHTTPTIVTNESVGCYHDAGAITNLMTEDATNIMSFFWIAHYVWAIPLKIAVVMYLLYLRLGISAVIGSVVCILTMTPLQFLIGKAMSSNAEVMAKYTDERLKCIYDAFVGIKTIKLNAWDEVFLRKIGAARNEELKYLNKDSIYWTLMTILMHISTVLITFVTLAVFVCLQEDSGATLTASHLFSALALFQQLTVPLLIFPITVPIIIAAVISTRRLERFLQAPEIQKQFEGIRHMARILCKSDASLDMYETPGPAAVQLTETTNSAATSATNTLEKAQVTSTLEQAQQQNHLNEQLALRINIPAATTMAPLATSEPQTPTTGVAGEAPPVLQAVSEDNEADDSCILRHAVDAKAKKSPKERKELLRNSPYVLVKPRKMSNTTSHLPAQMLSAAQLMQRKYDASHRDSFLLKMPDNMAVSVRGGVYGWHPKSLAQDYVLSISELLIPRNRLTLVLGKTGSGKSSLLAALLMEMPLLSGNMVWDRTCTVAFVPQQPWLLNASIRENILFGESYRRNRYDFVLDACALKPDIAIMPASDSTIIGERGINLSGGQRQRIAIARALYSSANVVIMDDPLASLDNEVAHHVFEQSIKRMLLKAKRTVILVTQQLKLAQQADYLIVLKAGRLHAAGTYKDIEHKQPHIIAKWNALIAKAKMAEHHGGEESQQQSTESVDGLAQLPNASGPTSRERWQLFKNMSKLGLQRSTSLNTGNNAAPVGGVASAVDAEKDIALDVAAATLAEDEDDDQLLPVDGPLCCSASLGSFNRFKRSSVYGSRNLIYDMPLPLDECQTEDVIMRRVRRRGSSIRSNASSSMSICNSAANSKQQQQQVISQQPMVVARRTQRLSGASSASTELLRRSLLTASYSSAASNNSDNSSNNNGLNNATSNHSKHNGSSTTPQRLTHSWQPQTAAVLGAGKLQHPLAARNISSPAGLLSSQQQGGQQQQQPQYQGDVTKGKTSSDVANAISLADAVKSVTAATTTRPSTATTAAATKTTGFQQFLRRMSMRGSTASYKPNASSNTVNAAEAAGTTLMGAAAAGALQHSQAHHQHHHRLARPLSAANSILSNSEESDSASTMELFNMRSSPMSQMLEADEEVDEVEIPIEIEPETETDSWLAHLDDDESLQDCSALNGGKYAVSPAASNATSNAIMHDVERKYGKIPLHIYLLYLRASGMVIAFVFFATALIWQCLRVYTDVWLQQWTDATTSSATTAVTIDSTRTTTIATPQYIREEDEEDQAAALQLQHEVTYYFHIYALISCVCIIMALISTPAGQLAGCNARRHMHERLVAALMAKSLRFFQLTPLGRIMNRFSNDMAVIDKKIAATSQRLLQFTLLCLCAVLINVSITPWFMLLTLPICAAYYAIQKFYRCSSRELQRIENSTNSPVISHLAETIQGVTTIRAYNQEARFTEILFQRLEANTIATTMLNTSNRWLGISLDYLGGVIVFVAIVTALVAATISCSDTVTTLTATDSSGGNLAVTLAATAAQSFASSNKSSNTNATTFPGADVTGDASPQHTAYKPTPSLVGLAINYTLLMPIYLNWVVKLLADMEMYVGSVERIAYYAETTTVKSTIRNLEKDAEVVAAPNDIVKSAHIEGQQGEGGAASTAAADGNCSTGQGSQAAQLVVEHEASVAAINNKLGSMVQLLDVSEQQHESQTNGAHQAAEEPAKLAWQVGERRRASEAERQLINGKRYRSVPISWPQRGDISFENVSLRYEGHAEDVIKNLTLHIPAGQRLGICGRTGSGKSSLALSLFGVGGLLQTTSGRILIDDVDIADIHPVEIRTRLSILPQDVHLFSATLRENLDPSGYYSDLALWQCLELAQLKDFVHCTLPLGLETKILSGGYNLSAGHRQLLCLARAILRCSVCLILDEATSALDSSTEKALLLAAHNAFRGRTIVSIVHRLSTILDYDRIIVLENGRIVEDGSPLELQAKSDNGAFYTLLHSGNNENQAQRAANDHTYSLSRPH